MSGLVVVDASLLVALFTDRGQDGDWAAEQTAAGALAAPELALFEAANTLRRLEMAQDIDPTQAALAHADLVHLPLQTWPYGPLADRVWELRTSVTAYDASYVALAELLDAPLLTLDTRLARAHSLRCTVVTPG